MSSAENTTRDRFNSIVADSTRTDVEAYWDVRDLYREHRSRDELDALLHYEHPIPVGRGWHRRHVEQNFQGWSWNQLIGVLRAAGLRIPRGGAPSCCHPDVQEFYFDSETSWLVLWGDGHKTCGPEAPGLTCPAPAGAETRVLNPTTERAAKRPVVTEADLLPWKVEDKHRDVGIMDRFRTILKQRNHEPTTDEEERRLHDWLEGLVELGAVVAYDPQEPPNGASERGGFYYVERLPEDSWIIRGPGIGSDGFRLS